MDLGKQQPKIAAGIAFWAATIFLAVSLFGCVREGYLSSVAHREQRIQGVIESPGRLNHGQPQYDYRFTLGRDVYHGSPDALPGHAYSEGRVVTIYYDPKYAETNSLISFGARTPAYFGCIMFAVAGVGVLIYAIVMWKRAPAGP